MNDKKKTEHNLTKNRTYLNNRKMKNHPPSPANTKQNTNKQYFIKIPLR